MTEEMSEKQAESILREFAEQKQGVHAFLTKIVENDDTTKTGNLNEDELGIPIVPVRTIKELELFCSTIYDHPGWADFFKKQAEIVNASSLSKDGLLVKLSVTNKREVADMTPKQKKNKRWFKKSN